MSIRFRQRGALGYSLIELLVVLAIVGILAIAGVTMIGNRGGDSVRVVLDELEGAIMDAHKFAASSGRDVAIVTWGPYDVTATTPTMFMARGVISDVQTPAAIQSVVLAPPAVLTEEERTVEVVFSPSRSREYANAGIVVNNGSTWWTNAMQANSSGKRNVDIITVAPFDADAAFVAANNPANNLFQGGLNQVTISGANKRFNTSFIIQVVGTSGGFAIPGGAMGLIVVLNNGATVYKFYNSGANNGDGQWRRI